ncbi:MAG: hypothetical protein ACU0CI_08535 [Shimia sp.]
MNDNVENMILVQLREMREEVREFRAENAARFAGIEERLENLEAGQQALQGVMLGLGRSLYLLEDRVEHIKAKLGIDD